MVLYVDVHGPFTWQLRGRYQSHALLLVCCSPPYLPPVLISAHSQLPDMIRTLVVFRLLLEIITHYLSSGEHPKQSQGGGGQWHWPRTVVIMRALQAQALVLAVR
jgi:hypothetical protein